MSIRLMPGFCFAVSPRCTWLKVSQLPSLDASSARRTFLVENRRVRDVTFSSEGTLNVTCRQADRPRMPVDESCLLDQVGRLQAACDGRLDLFSARKPEATAILLEDIDAIERWARTHPGAGFGSKSIESMIAGRWVLLFTDNAAIIKNKGGITGFPVPGTHCTRVEVSLDSSGRAQTVERLKLGFLAPTNDLIGKWSLSGKSGRILQVTYAEAVICGGPTLRADSKAVLETTYLSQDLRVGRSKSGDVFLFRRVKDGDEH